MELSRLLQFIHFRNEPNRSIVSSHEASVSVFFKMFSSGRAVCKPQFNLIANIV